MFSEQQAQAFQAFLQSAKDNRILDDKTTRLIYLASAMAVGCYP